MTETMINYLMTKGVILQKMQELMTADSLKQRGTKRAQEYRTNTMRGAQRHSCCSNYLQDGATRANQVVANGCSDICRVVCMCYAEPQAHDKIPG